MTSRKAPAIWLALASAAAGCGGNPISPPPPPPPPAGTPSVVCVSKPITNLAVGEHVIVDPVASAGCLRFAPPGAGGAQYLMVLASTSGERSSSGIQGPYVLKGSSPALASSNLRGVEAVQPVRPGRRSAAAEFDAALRRREEELVAQSARVAAAPAPGVPVAPPVVGEVKSFKVCTNLNCSAFATVQATARYVGTHAAVFIDNSVPQNDPLQPADAAELGLAFDTRHYPIDTTAFGRESDLDQNGVVIILMTDAVNDLTPDCTNGRVVGYFFGGDLLTGPNSNNGEVFYTLVPQPRVGTCGVITRRTAVDALKATLIHELQHMISFNQHVLVRSGNSEQTWLNEGLSHFAEELGGRLIPDSECTSATVQNCRSQYSSGNLVNSYEYLQNSEGNFLVFPTSSGATLPERGAAWLFVRWIADQFANDPILGTDLTRALVQTSLTGANNIQAVTGNTLSTLVPQWLMAAYLDDGPDLPSEPTGRLQFTSWGLRAIWTAPQNQAPEGEFSGFPVNPLVIGGSFSRSGTLRGGSGRHFLVIQQANGPAIDILAVKNDANELLDPLLLARVGLVRIH